VSHTNLPCRNSHTLKPQFCVIWFSDVADISCIPVLSYFNVLNNKFEKAVIPPSYFKLGRMPWKQLTLHTVEGLSWICSATRLPPPGMMWQYIHMYVCFCYEPFCWLMVTNLQSYVTGLQLRSIETGPKRLGAWSWPRPCMWKQIFYICGIYSSILEYFRMHFIAN
jgi:hypothetical protein